MIEQWQRINNVLGQIDYPGFEVTFEVGIPPSPMFLQLIFTEKCNATGGVPVIWKSRKWLLSQHMTDGEVVQTAFKAVLTALEHEAREKFRYKGVSVFDPHYDIDKLVELRTTGSTLSRSPSKRWQPSYVSKTT